MYRFEAIGRIGKGASHNHAHRVIKIRLAHLVININGANYTYVHVLGTFCSSVTRRRNDKDWLITCQIETKFRVDSKIRTGVLDYNTALTIYKQVNQSDMES